MFFSSFFVDNQLLMKSITIRKKFVCKCMMRWNFQTQNWWNERFSFIFQRNIQYRRPTLFHGVTILIGLSKNPQIINEKQFQNPSRCRGKTGFRSLKKHENSPVNKYSKHFWNSKFLMKNKKKFCIWKLPLSISLPVRLWRYLQALVLGVVQNG